VVVVPLSSKAEKRHRFDVPLDFLVIETVMTRRAHSVL
jgi:hypothetical protein